MTDKDTLRNRHDLTSAERKLMPVDRGFARYFPDAMMLVAMLSARANEKHAPGQPIHWVKGASADHGDCLVRHQSDTGTIDPEMGLDYAIHVAWRGMSQLQTMVEELGIDALVDWRKGAHTRGSTPEEIEAFDRVLQRHRGEIDSELER